jgi:hypothetical protein
LSFWDFSTEIPSAIFCLPKFGCDGTTTPSRPQALKASLPAPVCDNYEQLSNRANISQRTLYRLIRKGLPVEKGAGKAVAPAIDTDPPVPERVAPGGAATLVCRASADGKGKAAMRVHNLYADANGQSHFRDIEIEWVEETRSGKLSKRLPATGIIFREVPPTYDLDWHPAPRRQYIINLDAGVEITAGDGEARKIGAGEVLLVEDTTGKGHLSKALDGRIRNCIFVPID